MKLKLNKKSLKNLSRDSKLIPQELTPNIAGAGQRPGKTERCRTAYTVCYSQDTRCGEH
ncbi:hypothetical protein [Pseudoalteromonas denitrificans]|uniref:Uncharacterized protein n=1 Tax=Pseudoalteromonas denitrificans DSM 6059 TaxID=1123010 RepID=A0A1I1TNM9_9GAMM|nr:hypothetical protein [Pseudoalteromonas denitrificans]SFD60045.1 hypothetical protein SAMN02745724_04938 [Pseudoalteromonas denitrificans DSM 6059]